MSRLPLLTLLCPVLTACAGPASTAEAVPQGLPGPSIAPSVFAAGDDTFDCGPTLGVAQEQGLVVSLHTFEDSVTVLDPQTGAVDTLRLASEPTRLACSGDSFWVTLRGSGEVARLRWSHGSLWIQGTYPVGAEPYGIAVSAEGDAVYVALSREDAVVVLDPDTLTERERYPVSGDPRWLVLHPNDQDLFVASAHGARLTHIALDTLEQSSFGPPEVQGIEDLANLEGEVVLTPRLTGDLAVSADGDRLALPGLFVNNIFGASGQLSEGETSQEVIVEYYGSPSIVDPDPGSARFNPGIWMIDLDDLRPGSAPGDVMDIGGNAAFQDGRRPYVRSYLTGVAFAPGDAGVVGVMEASDTVVLAPLVDIWDSLHLGWTRLPQVFQATARGPRGVMFTDDELWIDEQLSGSMGRVDAREMLRDLVVLTDSRSVTTMPRFEGDSFQVRAAPADAELALGRDLFTTAISPTMVSEGAGVSCSTCHFEGRNDGLSWPLEDGPRQTPSLAGVVSHTVPVTWSEQVPTVAEEVLLTSIGRMGGEGGSDDEAQAVVTWIDAGRFPNAPLARLDPAAVSRGEALFLDPDVGCAGCHTPPLYTDNLAYDVLGTGPMNVPTLRGVGASAPYLHDGSAESLADVFLWSDAGAMGSTSHLSADQLDDLEAFLRSL